MLRDTVYAQLKSTRAHLFSRYPLKTLALFGSVARGEETPDSDIDVLVEFTQPIGFGFVDLAIELENLLQHKVDLVSRKGVKKELFSLIEEELVYV